MSRYPGIYPINTKSGKRYQAKWRSADGRQMAKNFRTLAEAIAYKNKEESDKKRGLSVDHRRAKTSFQAYAEEVFASMDHRPSTVRRRDGIMRKHIYPVLGNRQVGSIRRVDIQGLVTSWKSQGLSPRTILNHLRTLNLVFQTALDDDLILKSPLAGVKRPRPEEVRRTSLTPDQCRALLNATEASYRPLIRFLLATGLRWQEMVDLEISDFHALRNLISVRKSKTPAGRRDIPIDPSDTEMVSRYLVATGRTGADSDSPLFTSPNGQPLHYSNFRKRVFIPACEKAGLQGITIHDLRRTHASILVAEQHDIKVIQERMGHESISTTHTYYAQATEQGKVAAAGAANRYLGGATDESSQQSNASS